MYTATALFESNCPNLHLLHRGKVRDVYSVGDFLLIVATDRISAFDVIMSEPVPEKGKLLTDVSLFWFNQITNITKHHVVSTNIDDYPVECHEYREQLLGRSMLVKKTNPLPVECIVRGYLAGSGWKEYQKSQTVCGIDLPKQLQESSRLPEPIFTPSTKAQEGHDENITFEVAVESVGTETMEVVRKLSLNIYSFAASVAEQRGLILADTKFEFGIDAEGEIILIDEVLTPDSSRYWLKEDYEPGAEQTNFDKQVLRDYLESTSWNKTYPPPSLPQVVIDRTVKKYQEAMSRLTK